ncbi:MAG: barstar family protein [Rudaea sp.]|nr:barstar family protein [Rudaea sp.]
MFTRHANSLEINVSDVRSPEELHELLYQAFEFPEYYGRNWDAFDEYMRNVVAPRAIRVSGLMNMRFRMPKEAKLFVACLQDFVAKDTEHRIPLHVD